MSRGSPRNYEQILPFQSFEQGAASPNRLSDTWGNTMLSVIGIGERHQREGSLGLWA
jgi:hypothetical protein